MRQPVLLLFIALLGFTANARAEKVLAQVKISRTHLAGGYHDAKNNYERALDLLKVRAAEVAATTKGATRHVLDLKTVKQSAHAEETKVKGVVTVYGND
jgi:hypothetical protein